MILFFLVLAEESAAPTNHLPADVKGNSILASASAAGWLRLIVQQKSKDRKFFDLPIKTKNAVCK